MPGYKSFFVSLVVLAAATNIAYATVTFTLTEVAGGVSVDASGSYDLTGAHFSGSGSLSGFINGSLALGSTGLAVGGPLGTVDKYTLSSNAGGFGSGPFFVDGTPDTGDRFGLDAAAGVLTVPAGYVSGNPLAGTTFFAGSSFASLGLVPGVFVYGIPNDTLTVVVKDPASKSIPTLQPVSLIVLLLIMVSLAAYRLRGNDKSSSSRGCE